MGLLRPGPPKGQTVLPNNLQGRDRNSQGLRPHSPELGRSARRPRRPPLDVDLLLRDGQRLQLALELHLHFLAWAGGGCFEPAAVCCNLGLRAQRVVSQPHPQLLELGQLADGRCHGPGPVIASGARLHHRSERLVLQSAEIEGDSLAPLHYLQMVTTCTVTER